MNGPKSKVKKVRALHQRGKVLRQQEPLLAVIQWGVNHMMHEAYCVPEKALILESDFKASSKIHIQNHQYNNHVLPSKFKVKEYCPLVFRDVRRRFNEDPDEHLGSICDGYLDAAESAGKSNSVFFTTHDQRLVLKTLSKEEVSQFHNTFPSYHSFVVEHGSETLLPRYFGMYRVTIHDSHTYVVVMNNILSPGLEVHRKYDLKGSTVERNASEKELAKDLPTLKDNDLLAREERIQLGADKARVLEMMRRDVSFLQASNLMDYSLLLAIHSLGDGEMPEVDRKMHPSCLGDGKGGALYFLGIIDALTYYSTKKKAAHAAKTAKHGKAEFSTVNPEQYAKRFLDFMSSIID